MPKSVHVMSPSVRSSGSMPSRNGTVLPTAPVAASSSAPAAGTYGRRQNTKAARTIIATTNVSVPHEPTSIGIVGYGTSDTSSAVGSAVPDDLERNDVADASGTPAGGGPRLGPRDGRPPVHRDDDVARFGAAS